MQLSGNYIGIMGQSSPFDWNVRQSVPDLPDLSEEIIVEKIGELNEQAVDLNADTGMPKTVKRGDDSWYCKSLFAKDFLHKSRVQHSRKLIRNGQHVTTSRIYNHLVPTELKSVDNIPVLPNIGKMMNSALKHR